MSCNRFVRKCVRATLLVLITPSFGSFARIQLDDGSSLPITPTFNQIQMLINEDDRKVVLANSQNNPNSFLIMVIDGQMNAKSFRPELQLRRALNYPNLHMIPISRDTQTSTFEDQWYLLSEAGPISGFLMTYGLRRLHRGAVVFFLVSTDPAVDKAEATFWQVVNEFKPPAYSHVPFQELNRSLLIVAVVILAINVRVLWLAFKWYAELSNRSNEPSEVT